ncbi:hypothetical protein Q5752_002835 [Cryptotrichosporon argae]
MSGFQHAEVTKGVMLLLGATSLAASLLDIKPYLHLQLVPHLSKYHQFWRLLIHPLAFSNSTELVVGELLLYKIGAGIERSFGSRKFATFALISTIISTALSFVAIVLLHPFGLNAIPAGPYGLLFSLVWQWHRTVPSLYAFRVAGVEFSSKSYIWLLVAQLALSSTSSSLLAATSGLVVGYMYRTDTLFPVPTLSRRHLKPLKAYRLPLAIYLLLARVFAPFTGTSAPPRRSNRVLPGQAVSGTTAAPPPTPQGLPQGLGQLLARGGATRRRTGSPATPVTPATPRTAGAAVGEWVDDLTGSGAARAPTEEEIVALTNMFPNMSREAVVRALQRSEHNTARAVESLLEASG